jgi:hypothetical protein
VARVKRLVKVYGEYGAIRTGCRPGLAMAAIMARTRAIAFGIPPAHWILGRLEKLAASKSLKTQMNTNEHGWMFQRPRSKSMVRRRSPCSIEGFLPAGEVSYPYSSVFIEQFSF